MADHCLVTVSVTSVTFSGLKVIERHYERALGLVTEEPLLQSENSTLVEGNEVHSSVVMYWSLSVAIFSVGGMVSSFLVGFVGDLRGR